MEKGAFIMPNKYTIGKSKEQTDQIKSVDSFIYGFRVHYDK